MASKKEIVVVTGSSGCLGQHIVKLLQEKDDNIAEIRLFDKKPYENILGHSEQKKMVHFPNDIRDTPVLLKALDGADCVIHCAAVIDTSLIPDTSTMFSVNVDGTKDIIEGCLEKNVPRLVFASTTDMVCGSEHIFYGTESTTPIPTSFMIGKYGESKCLAEDLVLNASRKLCADGKTILSTVSLRPTPFFGENDKIFFFNFLKYTKRFNGTYYRIRSLDERLQITYVGNVAWSFLKAKEKLAVDETISGEAFFITDDTSIIDVHEHVQPFVESRGFTVSSHIIPYWLAWFFLSIVCLFFRILNIFFRYQPDIPNIYQLNYMCSTFFFNRSKATLRLDYQPIYTPEEALERSKPFYSKVDLSC